MPTCYKLARMVSGKSQLDVSISTGMHQSIISQIENGRRNPTKSEIDALAKVYGMTPKQLQNLSVKGVSNDVSA